MWLSGTQPGATIPESTLEALSNYVHLSDLAMCSHMYLQEIPTWSCSRQEEVL